MLKRIIIGPGYPLRGGISESNQALDECFQKKGESSHIISYNLQYPKLLFPGKKQTIQGTIHPHPTTVELINTINPFSWYQCVKYIIAENPDYVIVRYWHPYFALCLSYISRALLKESISVLAWIDNINPHESVPFQTILTNTFLKYCDSLLVMSYAVKEEVLKYNVAKDKLITVSPHPIYNVFGSIIPKKKARKRLGLTSESIDNTRYILFFGLIRQYKGLDLLLDVMSSDKIKELNIKLIVAGEFYDSKTKYIDKIKSLGIEDSIVIHDFYIPNESVVNYFCASDIVVQPYLSATQSGVSMVACNFNKPMLLTNVGGLSEYVNDQQDGYLVNVDKTSIIEALEDYYLNNREEAFVSQIKQKKTSLTWGHLANEFDKLYKKSDNV